MLHRATLWILTAVITAYAGADSGSGRMPGPQFSIARCSENQADRQVVRLRCLRSPVTHRL